VPAWLSEDGLKELAALAGSRPPVPGATGTVSVTIAGAPGGDAAYHWSYRDGTPGDGGIGPAAQADLALSIAAADAETVATGAVEPSVAYMRGRLKATGDGALLLGVLASTATGRYEEWRRQAVRVLGAAPPGH
jgi:hypothetical protein